MSAVESFEINLEHDIDEQYQYEPGAILRGHVVLKLSAQIKVKAIQVQIKGEATVSWEDEAGRNPQSYRADETYIDLTQNLMTSLDGKSQTMEAGKHRFPMEYELPMNLPSSFIGKYGSITYVVKATLKEDKRFGLSTLITSEPFLVLRKLDLTSDASLQKPHESTASKRLYGALAFCVFGSVNVDLKINKTGHLPGEDVYMDAEISNGSPRIVKAVQASIIMHSSFHAQSNVKHNTQMVNKKRDEWEMANGEGRRWKGVRLTIPPYIPESRLDGCDIMDIRYELIFKVDISGGNEIKLMVPLTVGTIQGHEGAPRSRTGGGVPNGDSYAKPPPENTTGEDETEINGNVSEDYSTGMDEEEKQKFRYPLEHGDTRRNPLYQN